MNKPAQEAARIYEQLDGDFAYAIKWHLANGVLLSMPTFFVLGYYCKKDAPDVHVPLAEADCFHATMCVGDMREASLQLANHVEWLAFERETRGDNHIRVVNYKRFLEKCPKY